MIKRLIWSMLVFLLIASKSLAQDQVICLSQQLLERIKAAEPYQELIDQLAKIPMQKLHDELNSDPKKQVFWINIYNAFIQHILSNQPQLYENKSRFFKTDFITIAGAQMSFDFIEHGILRSSKVKLSLGYMNDPFASSLERSLRVQDLDARIHFALNCGAIFCTPVPILYLNTLDRQLDAASRFFLQQSTIIDDAKKSLHLTQLFNWFRADFNDRGGAIGYLLHYGIIEESQKGYSLQYSEYNWTLKLNYFTVGN
jgi:hypothetical protein